MNFSNFLEKKIQNITNHCSMSMCEEWNWAKIIVEVNILVRHYSSFADLAYFQHKFLSVEDVSTEAMLHKLRLSKQWGKRSSWTTDVKYQTVHFVHLSGECLPLHPWNCVRAFVYVSFFKALCSCVVEAPESRVWRSYCVCALLALQWPLFTVEWRVLHIYCARQYGPFMSGLRWELRGVGSLHNMT